MCSNRIGGGAIISTATDVCDLDMMDTNKPVIIMCVILGRCTACLYCDVGVVALNRCIAAREAA